MVAETLKFGIKVSIYLINKIHNLLIPNNNNQTRNTIVRPSHYFQGLLFAD